MDCSTPGNPVHHQLLQFTQTHVHWVGDAIQPSHPLSSHSPSVFIGEINIPLAHDLSLGNIQPLKDEEEKIKNIYIKNPRSLLTFNCIRFHLKRPWCWERLKVGVEWDDRGWDGWMASPTQWTWVWVNCRSWWWTGRPGVLQYMGSHRIGHDWATKLNWAEWMWREGEGLMQNACDNLQRKGELTLWGWDGGGWLEMGQGVGSYFYRRWWYPRSGKISVVAGETV